MNWSVCRHCQPYVVSMFCINFFVLRFRQHLLNSKFQAELDITHGGSATPKPKRHHRHPWRIQRRNNHWSPIFKHKESYVESSSVSILCASCMGTKFWAINPGPWQQQAKSRRCSRWGLSSVRLEKVLALWKSWLGPWFRQEPHCSEQLKSCLEVAKGLSNSASAPRGKCLLKWSIPSERWRGMTNTQTGMAWQIPSSWSQAIPISYMNIARFLPQ